MSDASDDEIRALVAEMERGLHAWISGQTERGGTTRMVQAPDMTIFGPFGGEAVRNGPGFTERQAQVSARFLGGTGTCELVEAMSAGDLVVLVMVERCRVRFAEGAQPQQWALRTTQVFRRDGERWIRLHRHADPLIERRSFEATIALAAEH